MYYTYNGIKKLITNLINCSNENEIQPAIDFIKNAVNDNDWIKHTSEVVAGIEIARQILINIFLK